MAKKAAAKRARFDPLKSSKFRVSWEGKHVAVAGKVGPLKRVTEVLTQRDGSDPSVSRKSPGRTEYEAVTLEGVVTLDAGFEQWASKAGGGAPPPEFRRNLVIEVYSKARRLVAAYKLFRCWVSEFTVLAEPDADPVVTLYLTLENEGWERDDDAAAPPKP